MKIRKLSIAALLVATAFGATAWAGYRYPFEVQINTTSRTAKGSLGSARASADNNQAIGCRIGAGAGGIPVVYCFAVDAAGTTASCSTPDPAIATVATAINDSSLISFTWNAGGACLSLTVENYSTNPPLQP
jgi:hypothetical protein